MLLNNKKEDKNLRKLFNKLMYFNNLLENNVIKNNFQIYVIKFNVFLEFKRILNCIE